MAFRRPWKASENEWTSNWLLIRLAHRKLLLNSPHSIGTSSSTILYRLESILYTGIVQNHHVQIPLRGDFAQVRITCQIGLHRYRLFYISHTNALPIQRYGGQLRRVRHVRLYSRTSPIRWDSSKNVWHPPSQWQTEIYGERCFPPVHSKASSPPTTI